jgi:hypothetical protein
MQDGRPAYRINTGRVFGKWTVVYADTGEKMPPMNADAAMDWMRRTRPEMASNLTYDCASAKAGPLCENSCDATAAADASHRRQ